MAYTTKATTKGGRNGRAMLDDGGLALAMSAPKEIGGAGDGHNPEQLFALGYSSCYGQANLKVSLPGADKDKLKALVEEAHQVCPYSKATRGNMPVTLTVE
jgi:osmotically inducible protein OsmC